MLPRISSLEELPWRLPRKGNVLCLFSGGLDGSYLLRYLADRTTCNVTALSVLIGQELDVERAGQFAKSCRASHEVVDCSDEFAKNFLRSAIKAQATYLGGHPISASLSRPLIAQKAVEVARSRECVAILHTSTSSQNSLRRFNQSIADLGFEGLWGSPYERSSISRENKLAALSDAGIHAAAARGFSEDSNLWCREIESGDLDDPEAPAIKLAPFAWSSMAAGGIEEERTVSIRFRGGEPKAIDGQPLALKDVIATLNKLAGGFGVGRFVGLEEIPGGSKVQEVREMPAAALLLAAYRALESACLLAETIRIKQSLEQIWVREAVEGRWFGTLRGSAESFIRIAARKVTGECRISLTPGAFSVAGIRADSPLYVRDRRVLEQENAGELAQEVNTAAIDGVERLQHRVNETFLRFDFGEKYPLPRMVAAYVLTKEQKGQIGDLTRDVTTYLRDLLPRIQSKESFLEQAILRGGFDKEQRTLFAGSSGQLPRSPFLVRVDCVWDGAKFWICEINVDAVGGVEDAYFLRRVYDEHLPKLRAASDLPIAGACLARYLQQRWPGRGLIVYTDESCRNAGGRLAAALCHEGLDVQAVHINNIPENLSGYAWMWRHLLLTDLFVDQTQAGPVPAPTDTAIRRFFKICQEGRVPILSPIRDRLLFDKRFLIEDFARQLGAESSWDGVAPWIPATRLAAAGEYASLSAVPKGKVLKPVLGFGGEGVRFAGGVLPSEAEWKRESWVEQRMIDGETIAAYGGEVPRFRVVHGIHILDGEFIGDHIRLGAGFLARGSGGYIPVY